MFCRISLSILLAGALTACSSGAPPIDMAKARAARFADYRGDATRGQVLFGACASCHSANPGVNRAGPSLFAVVGRPAGQIAGYHYSPANRASHLRWDEPTLFRYLLEPQAVVPGTFMSFAGLPDPQARADVIAYLRTRQ